MSTKNNSLKVAFLLDSSLDFRGGVQQYILILGDYLKSKGHEVHYIVGQSDQNSRPNVHSLAKNFKIKFNGNLVSTSLPTSKLKIKKFLAKNKFDVVHVQMPYSPFYIARLIKYLPKETAIVGTFHILPYGKTAENWSKVLAKILAPTLKKFDQIICVSEANQKFFKETFKRNSIVLPNMVDVDEFRPKKEIKKNNKIHQLLYSGRITERKGCRYLVQALGLLKQIHPELKFHLKIAGQGEQTNLLKKIAKELNIDKEVEFSGFLSDEDKIKFMQNSDTIIFPAYSGESFGIVLLEGIASMGGVVVGGDNPGYRTVLGTIEESLAPVTDTKKFAEYLYEIMTNKKLRKSIYNKQQNIIDKFDYKNIGNQIFEVYEACITQKNKP